MIVSAHTAGDQPRGDQGLVPLINVVFLLLTFFVIAGQIQRAEGVRVRPPVSASEAVPLASRVELVVDLDGRLYMHGAEVEDSLDAVLRRVKATVGGSDLDVLVKADADLAVERLESVLFDLMQAGVVRVSVATTPDPER